MIKVIHSNGNFLAKGVFSLGLAGIFENKAFGENNITIKDSLQQLISESKDENSFFYKPLLPFLADKADDAGAIANGLEEYYNFKESQSKST